MQKQGVSLSLTHAQNTVYDLEVPTHTAQELRQLSSTTDRMEFRSRTNFDFVSSVEVEAYEAFLREISEPPSSKL